jgi:hypothetical protein
LLDSLGRQPVSGIGENAGTELYHHKRSVFEKLGAHAGLLAEGP